MPSVDGLPDEYLQGFMKSGEALWGSFVRQFGLADGSSGGVLSLPLDKLSNVQNIHSSYWQQQIALWASMAARATGQAPNAAVTPVTDRRFSAKAWGETPYFDLLRQAYLSELALDRGHGGDGRCGRKDATQAALLFAPVHRRCRARPTSLRPTRMPSGAPVESQGESVLSGMQNLLSDLRKGGVDHRRERRSRSARTLPSRRARWSSRTNCSS